MSALSGLIGALIGGVIAYVGAIHATRCAERSRSVSAFKSLLIPFLMGIQEKHTDAPSDSIKDCITRCDNEAIVCQYFFGNHDRLRFSALWDKLKYGDQKHHHAVDTDQEYWAELGQPSVQASRLKAIGRFQAILAFTPSV